MRTSEAAWFWKAIHPRTIQELASPTSTTKGLAEPEFLKSTDSWKFLMEYAERMNADVLLAAAIEHSSWQHRIPEALHRQIEKRVRRERMRLALLDDELDFAFDQFSSAGIPCVVLKGMDLGRRYYPSRIFRPMTDVDLLVQPKDFEPAIQRLLEAGFQIVGNFPKGRFRIELGRFPAGVQEGPVIELHKYLQEGDNDHSIAAIWDRAESGIIPGLPRAALALAPEDLLPYLIRHAGVQHVVDSPVWLNDLHFIASSPQIRAQCESISENLARSKAVAAGYFLMTFLKRYYGTEIPEACLAFLQSKLRPLQARMLSNRAKPSALFPPNGRSMTWTATTRLLLRDSPIEAFSYAVRRFKSF